MNECKELKRESPSQQNIFLAYTVCGLIMFSYGTIVAFGCV